MNPSTRNVKRNTLTSLVAHVSCNNTIITHLLIPYLDDHSVTVQTKPKVSGVGQWIGHRWKCKWLHQQQALSSKSSKVRHAVVVWVLSHIVNKRRHFIPRSVGRLCRCIGSERNEVVALQCCGQNGLWEMIVMTGSRQVDWKKRYNDESFIVKLMIFGDILRIPSYFITLLVGIGQW